MPFKCSNVKELWCHYMYSRAIAMEIHFSFGKLYAVAKVYTYIFLVWRFRIFGRQLCEARGETKTMQKRWEIQVKMNWNQFVFTSNSQLVRNCASHEGKGVFVSPQYMAFCYTDKWLFPCIYLRLCLFHVRKIHIIHIALENWK